VNKTACLCEACDVYSQQHNGSDANSKITIVLVIAIHEQPIQENGGIGAVTGH
jgi:hypothetical protein